MKEKVRGDLKVELFVEEYEGWIYDDEYDSYVDFSYDEELFTTAFRGILKIYRYDPELGEYVLELEREGRYFVDVWGKIMSIRKFRGEGAPTLVVIANEAIAEVESVGEREREIGEFIFRLVRREI